MTEQELARIEAIHPRHDHSHAEPACEHCSDDIPKLTAEVRRLQGLIKQAEWSDCDGGGDCCPWCQAEELVFRRGNSLGLGLGLGMVKGKHKPDCPAFPAVKETPTT